MKEYSPKKIKELLELEDYSTLKKYMEEHELCIANGKILPKNIDYYRTLHERYDRLQLIKKILLNSCYGSIGNFSSKWFDERIAQSTTLTGRCIVRHMGSKINEIIDGDYNYKGRSVIYGDTDSNYFSAYPVMKDLEDFKDFEWTKENVANLYDNIADATNASFPAFMKQAFNTPEERGSIIRAGRELCATKGIFITKKRYAVMIYDKEGKRKDVNGKPGEIKVMGLDIKRADSSPVIQSFLLNILTEVLTGVSKEQIFEKIQKFRDEFNSWPSWAKGSPKRVNNLTQYGNLKKSMESMSDVFKSNNVKKKTIPGHVVASINYNHLRKIYNDNESMPIQDGSKVIVCKLKSNPLGMTSIAYPVDLLILPDWFKQLPFDDALMEETVIDKKLENMLSVLNWDLTKTKKENQSFTDIFAF